MTITLTPGQALAPSLNAHNFGARSRPVVEIAGSLVGLHNTTQSTPFLSVRARLSGFSRSQLETPMWEEWTLSRFRAMRLTMFIFPNDLLEIAAAATRHISAGLAERWLRDSGLAQSTVAAIAEDVEEALVDGELTVRALRRVLGVPASIDLPGIVGRMCDMGRLAGGAPPRSWRSGVRQYHRWADVLPSVDPFRWDEADAIRELIRRYLVAYGPVTINDISWWSGITKARCRIALADLDVEEVAVDGWPGPLWRIATVAENVPDDVRALPLLDPYIQGYRDRERMLGRDRHGYVWDGGGNGTATLVHRGRIIGVWQVVEKPVPGVRYHLFDSPSDSTRRAAEQDLAAAGALYFDRAVDVVELTEMKPLHADGGRSANHPLDDRRHRASRR